MFAVVRTGGKQYRVAPGDKIVVEKLAGAAGETITLSDILLAGEGAELRATDGFTVEAEIIAQAKAEKVIVFKKRRRHNYRRKNGHRQQHTILRIMAVGGERAEPRPQAAAETPAPVETTAAAEAPAPSRAPQAPAATEPQAQAPLKIDGAESPMTDSPVAEKTDAPVADKDA